MKRPRLVLIELKVVEAITDIHVAQMLSYLKLGGWRVGLLNFNVKTKKDGLRRVVNRL